MLEKVDGCVLKEVVFSHQGTDRITIHQDWRNILAPGKMMTNEILGTMLTVSIYGHSKQLQLQTSLDKTWILSESFWKKWHKVNTQEKASGRSGFILRKGNLEKSHGRSQSGKSTQSVKDVVSLANER